MRLQCHRAAGVTLEDNSCACLLGTTSKQKALYDYMRKGIVSKFNSFKAARDDDALMDPWNPWLHEPDIGKAILAIAAVWDGVPVQRCTVHKHRNLLAHAPERLHEEIGADYSNMIYAATRED